MPEPSLVAKALSDFFKTGRHCLLAGAGVGMHVRLPSWQQYMEHLAKVAARHEAETATLMRKRVAQGNLLEAGRLYRACDLIPAGEKLEETAAPFRAFDPLPLRSLVSLPFHAIVTTNFDRSLHDAYHSLDLKPHQSTSEGKAPLCVEIDDESMNQAVFYRDFFIARLHGRAELPRSISIDSDDYRRLRELPRYHDFLVHILKTFRCLWLGFSFNDPSLNSILSTMNDLLASALPAGHLALIPADAPSDLDTRLAAQNVQVIRYDHANAHEALWSGIAEFHSSQVIVGIGPRTIKTPNADGLSRFLASAFARLSLAKSATPLRGIVIEGIVAEILRSAGSVGRSEQQVVAEVRPYISLPEPQVASLVRGALEGLCDAEVCVEVGGHYGYLGSEPGELAKAMESLTGSVLDRLKVREGLNADGATRLEIRKCLQELLMLRGWDLGAHLAAGGAGSRFESWEAIKETVTAIFGDSSKISAAVTQSILDVLRHPDGPESALLVDLGRAAFGVEMVLNVASGTMALKGLIPDLIYLDANVLMPILVPGHPYSGAYSATIARIRTATDQQGRGGTRVCTAREFLNELVSHRHNAMELVKELNLDDPDSLTKFLLFHGAQNVNVFVGGYATAVGREKNAVKFETYLAHIAPYNNEDDLERFLKEKGIHTVRLSDDPAVRRDRFEEIRRALIVGYGEAGGREKPDILVSHEAAQLARISADLDTGRHPLFVTADRRLMSICKGKVLGRLSHTLVSELGLLQLVDLLLGVETDKKALARLMWGTDISDQKTRLRNYFVDLALRHYDEGMATATWQVVDRIAERAASAARSESVVFANATVPESIRASKFLDRFEDEFFKNMGEALKSGS